MLRVSPAPFLIFSLCRIGLPFNVGQTYRQPTMDCRQILTRITDTRKSSANGLAGGKVAVGVRSKWPQEFE